MFLFQKNLEVMQGHGNLRRRERNDMDKTTSKKDSPEKKRKLNDKTDLLVLFDLLSWNQMYKIHLRKKRLEPYFRNMYVLNLLKEQQLRNFLKFQTEG